MNLPLVNIIIPAHNAAGLISEALQSVQEQTYSHWQVIVVEDGTQDSTEAIVQIFAQAMGEGKVRYIRHPENQGVSATRNTAIAAAQGQYIALLDHDDTWEPEHLEKLVTRLEQTGADFAYAPAVFFEYHTHREIGIHGPQASEWTEFPHSLFNRSYIPVSGVVIRRSAANQVGGFDPKLQKAEDLDYWLRCVEAGLRFEYVSEVTNGYRQRNPKAATADKRGILEGHARVLRKHRNLTAVSRSVRDLVLARYHLGVVRRSFKTEPAKAWEFLYWSIRITPLGSLAALRWFLLETLGRETRYTTRGVA